MSRKASLLQDPFLSKEQLAFAKQALRRASYRWPARNEAIKVSRVERGLYRCNKCGQQVRNKDKQVDHVRPVVRMSGRKQTLGELAARLYAPLEGWQILCLSCHAAKTAAENIQRRKK